MRVIEASRLAEDIEALCLEVSSNYPPDAVEALSAYRASEESRTGRRVIDLILENARVASELGVPICQDTGMFTIYLKLAPEDSLSGDFPLEASKAVARATRSGSLRPSVVSDPLGGRANTGDNTPPVVEVELSSGPGSTLGVLAKGGGSEMASRLAMMSPGAGWSGALDFIAGTIEELGARACPPLVLGVGIGGSFDMAPRLAKQALMRPLDEETADPAARAREAELISRVNELGIGPGGHGGTVTCFGARIIEAPCHMANLPVAVSVNCHALRRKTITI